LPDWELADELQAANEHEIAADFFIYNKTTWEQRLEIQRNKPNDSQSRDIEESERT
jgi:hypothetical protein